MSRQAWQSRPRMPGPNPPTRLFCRRLEGASTKVESMIMGPTWRGKPHDSAGREFFEEREDVLVETVIGRNFNFEDFFWTDGLHEEMWPEREGFLRGQPSPMNDWEGSFAQLRVGIEWSMHEAYNELKRCSPMFFYCICCPQSIYACGI